ncbi:unnamed protein product [Spodoptera littoralis]|uniref:Secreted protein n=1 Tax=Spodoptera littoralis TaxID=7109 RepID=A0A9P0N2H4_SPOLI|nr:unnamed protein product [Spodoptera littoralis]CAH1637491.1 unnamed protein product [Spodoptera littoralis]
MPRDAPATAALAAATLAVLAALVACVEKECIDWEGKSVPHGLLYVPGPGFCKNFRVGARCCEFECLDPPGEDVRYRERERLRALILSGNSSAPHHGPSMELKAGISLLAVVVARFV